MCHTGFEMKKFCTWEEFVSWKETEEESTHTYFVQPKSEEISHIQEKSKCQMNFMLTGTYCAYKYIISGKESSVCLLP